MAEEEKPQVTFRINDTAAAGILIFAITSDIFSVLPILNDIDAVITQIILYIIFSAYGVNPLAQKNWVWYLVTWIVELIPGVSALPMFVIECFRWIAISRVEDEIKAKTGFDADTKKVRAMANKVLQNKKLQELTNAGARNATAYDAKKARQDSEKRGETGADKRGNIQGAIANKRGNIDNAKRNLDSAIDPNAKNASSGPERWANQALAGVGRERARARDERLGGTQTYMPSIDGIINAPDSASAANDNNPASESEAA